MRSILKKSRVSRHLVVASLCLIFAAIGVATTSRAQAMSQQPTAGQRLITIHDNGKDKTILTKASTLRQAFEESSVRFDDNDMVEPGIDEKLVANNYEVNVYRARPITIIDGAIRQRVMSAYRTAGQIVAHAGMTLHDEDRTSMGITTNMVSDGAGMQLSIDRATPFTLVLYGKKTQSYTQATTVEQMLAEKKITLASNDTLSVTTTRAITAGMKIELWRNGTQTITEDKAIGFDVEQIQDMDREVGYKQVKTPGIKGKRTVTYEVFMKNGVEVRRKEIQSVVMKKPETQVEIVGAKPSFGGDFAAALAKLRSCEGNYNSWNPAGPYYGAYQFDESTWSSSAPTGAEYGNASPAQQDQAARNLYVRRGWSPWPVCGAGLPDTYR